jgi:hypothetical protein
MRDAECHQTRPANRPERSRRIRHGNRAAACKSMFLLPIRPSGLVKLCVRSLQEPFRPTDSRPDCQPQRWRRVLPGRDLHDGDHVTAAASAPPPSPSAVNQRGRQSVMIAPTHADAPRSLLRASGYVSGYAASRSRRARTAHQTTSVHKLFATGRDMRADSHLPVLMSLSNITRNVTRALTKIAQKNRRDITRKSAARRTGTCLESPGVARSSSPDLSGGIGRGTARRSTAAPP